jgi:CHAT domain-containing protein
LYGSLIAESLQHGEDQLAFQTAERFKAKSLVELLSTRQLRSGKPEVDELLEELDSLDTRLSRRHKESPFTVGMPRESADHVQRSIPVAKKRQMRERRKIALSELRRLNPELARLITVEPSSITEIQAHVGENTTLVAFHEARPITVGEAAAGRYVAFTLTRETFEAHELSVSPSHVEAAVEELSAQLTSPQRSLTPVRAPTEQLYDYLIRPIEKDLVGSELILIPHGATHRIPFAVLHDGEQHLGDKYTLTNAPSATVYTLLQQREQSTATGLLALGNPAGYLGSLSGAEEEVQAIQSLFEQSVVFTEDQATEQALKDRHTGLRVLHIAGHGVYDRASPMRSHLVLAPDDTNDGRLEAHEAYSLDLEGTELVVLSACDSGSGVVAGGNEVISLTRPFLYSGAQKVVASLWKVNDSATRDLMVSFYEHYTVNGTTASEALQLAQEEMRASDRYRHPYYWAAFQVIGSNR